MSEAIITDCRAAIRAVCVDVAADFGARITAMAEMVAEMPPEVVRQAFCGENPLGRNLIDGASNLEDVARRMRELHQRLQDRMRQDVADSN